MLIRMRAKQTFLFMTPIFGPVTVKFGNFKTFYINIL